MVRNNKLLLIIPFTIWCAMLGWNLMIHWQRNVWMIDLTKNHKVTFIIILEYDQGK